MRIAVLTASLLFASCATASSTRYDGFNVPHPSAPGVMLPLYLDDDFPVCIDQGTREPICISFGDLYTFLRSRRKL